MNTRTPPSTQIPRLHSWMVSFPNPTLATLPKLLLLFLLHCNGMHRLPSANHNRNQDKCKELCVPAVLPIPVDLAIIFPFLSKRRITTSCNRSSGSEQMPVGDRNVPRFIEARVLWVRKCSRNTIILFKIWNLNSLKSNNREEHPISCFRLSVHKRHVEEYELQLRTL